MPRNKIAIVTGANKGLGFYIVKSLCKEYDGKVYLTSRDEKRGLIACEELKKTGFNPEYHQLDVTNNESIQKFVKHISGQNEDVDILINNAGILFLKDAKEPKAYKAEETVKVNFFSLVNFTEAILPLIGDGARIVNISSSSAHLSRLPSEILREKFRSHLNLEELKDLMNSYLEAVKTDDEISQGWGDSDYVVSKVGVNAYTFMLHRKLNPKGKVEETRTISVRIVRSVQAQTGVTVNCIHPGYVMSDMTRGAGNVAPEAAAEHPVRLALRPSSSGQYIWHNGVNVPWVGPDPRGYIDGKN